MLDLQNNQMFPLLKSKQEIRKFDNYSDDEIDQRKKSFNSIKKTHFLFYISFIIVQATKTNEQKNQTS